MPSLDDDFQQLAHRLRGPGSLTASRTDPFYYLVYSPADALQVKRKIPVWIAGLRNVGLHVERVSFSDLLWQIVDASGRWDAWLEAEAEADQDQVNEAVRSVLRGPGGLVETVAAIVGQERAGTAVFLTETEILHPYFGVRSLEAALHDRIKLPTVVFYPGRRSGHFGLHFLDLFPEDSNYRATLIGGLP